MDKKKNGQYLYRSAGASESDRSVACLASVRYKRPFTSPPPAPWAIFPAREFSLFDLKLFSENPLQEREGAKK